MKYSSKKDLWLMLFIWISMLFSIGSSIYGLIVKEAGMAGFIIVSLMGVLLPIFFLWMLYSTYYLVTETHLIIRFGPFKQVIPLDSIKSVQNTNSPLSGPALSMKKIEIKYGKYDSVLISPKDREAFMDMLVEKYPEIKIIK
ncbi:PH domain-containing protein [Bacillus tuaregi]|uniref:PH domain-containing protein n=1 Tax=Bacillus tuaregi TaxID=1816695 RepID=UPI0008F885D7|nr:PH domain-containing protein [Bacillus tuaregi]